MDYRYPGPHPFTEDDRRVFFGRNDEKEYIASLILNHKVSVIHGKSGFGKSSLLNAGLLPYIREKYSWTVISTRLTNNERGVSHPPRKVFATKLKERIDSSIYLSDLLKNKEKETLWELMKTVYRQDLEKLSEEQKKLPHPITYLIVIDQFEELFTYPADDVKAFANELSELMYNRIPLQHQEKIKSTYYKDEAVDRFKDELAFLDKEIPVKLVISLRADRFSNLTYLKPYFPDLLANTYKLKRMNTIQVMEAIVEPALIRNGYSPPTFEYQQELLYDIVDYLTNYSDDIDLKKIEIFQMQIICRSLEEIARNYYNQNRATIQPSKKADFVLTKEIVMAAPNIKDKHHPFQDIIKNYYQHCLHEVRRLGEAEYLSSRYLIEKKLVDERTGNRISLDIALIEELGMKQETLEQLIESRMVRLERNTVSGHSVEISHDSMVTAIQRSAKETEQLDYSLYNFTEKALNAAPSNEKGEILKFIYELVDCSSPVTDDLASNAAAVRYLQQTDLLKRTRLGEDKIDYYSIRTAFRNQVEKIKNRRGKKMTRKRLYMLSAIALAFLIFSVLLFTVASNQVKRSVRTLALLYLCDSIDAFPDKEKAIRVTDYIYTHQILYPADSLIVQRQFNNLLLSEPISSKVELFSVDVLRSDLRADQIDISPKGNYVLTFFGSSRSDSTIGSVPNLPSDPVLRCLLLNSQGKAIDSFTNVSYGYFTNHDSILVIGKTVGENITVRMPNRLYFYDCSKRKMIDSLRMPTNCYLQSSINIFSTYFSTEYDSYRIRFLANGNIIIPWVRMDMSRTKGFVKLYRKNGVDVDFPCDWSVSTTRDMTKFMTAIEHEDDVAQVVVFDQHGQTVYDTRSLTVNDFSDFTLRGNVFYSHSGPYSMNIFMDIPNRPVNTQVSLSTQYGYTDERYFLSRLRVGGVYFKDLVTNKVIENTDRFLGVRFATKSFVTYSLARDFGKEEPDTIKYYDFGKDKPVRYYLVPGEIMNISYNEYTGDILVFDLKNRLLLLSHELEVKAGLQLTVNDLFKFSTDGSKIMVVKNQYLKLYKNDSTLANFLDFNDAHRWFEEQNVIKPLSEQDQEYYNRIFSKSIF